jgi:DNA-binding NarL/FixJ family response regulator
MNSNRGAYGVLLADDHAMLRQTIKRILLTEPGVNVLEEFGDGLTLLAFLASCRNTPAMIILDISMPHLNGIEVARIVKKRWTNVKVLMLTEHKDVLLAEEAFAAGADGYLLKANSAHELIPAMTKLRQGGTYIPSFFPARMADDRPDLQRKAKPNRKATRRRSCDDPSKSLP